MPPTQDERAALCGIAIKQADPALPEELASLAPDQTKWGDWTNLRFSLGDEAAVAKAATDFAALTDEQPDAYTLLEKIVIGQSIALAEKSFTPPPSASRKTAAERFEELLTESLVLPEGSEPATGTTDPTADGPAVLSAFHKALSEQDIDDEEFEALCGTALPALKTAHAASDPAERERASKAFSMADDLLATEKVGVPLSKKNKRHAQLAHNNLAMLPGVGCLASNVDPDAETPAEEAAEDGAAKALTAKALSEVQLEVDGVDQETVNRVKSLIVAHVAQIEEASAPGTEPQAAPGELSSPPASSTPADPGSESLTSAQKQLDAVSADLAREKAAAEQATSELSRVQGESVQREKDLSEQLATAQARVDELAKREKDLTAALGEEVPDPLLGTQAPAAPRKAFTLDRTHEHIPTPIRLKE